MREKHIHFLDANPEIRAFMEQVNRDQALKVETIAEKKGVKVGENLPDIKRLAIKDPKDASKAKPKRQRLINVYDSIIQKNLKKFESPSTETDSDGKNLSERRFKLSYKDMGIDLKTADEATTMTDSATETTTESATEQTTDTSSAKEEPVFRAVTDMTGAAKNVKDIREAKKTSEETEAATSTEAETTTKEEEFKEKKEEEP